MLKRSEVVRSASVSPLGEVGLLWTAMSGAHRRYNPLLDEWVLCSPGRLRRPWLGATEPGTRDVVAAYEPDCYMCPGNNRASGVRNPDYRGPYAFDNDYPALSASGGVGEKSHPLFLAVPERGLCRVLCFSERHDRHFGTMSVEEVRAVVDAWATESDRLSRREGVAYVQIFENRGALMGASNPHPHGQVWAVEHVPSIPRRKLENLDVYSSTHGSDLLGDYLKEETRRNERIVASTDHWCQVVPFWAVWPFETMLIPKRLVGSLEDLSDTERSDLATLLGSVVRRYDALFQTSFPYSMGWHERPRGGGAHGGVRLHAVFLPPLLRSATVRKFLVGYELTSEPQRDSTPEEAAERLRAVSS